MTGPVTQLTPDSLMAKQLVRWKVLMTSRIPTVANDLPPGEMARMWSSISSTLINGERDAVLVDAPTTAEQAAALTEGVITSGKNLTTIHLTHDHGDHFFGTGTLQDRFPSARAITTADVIKLIIGRGRPR
jgi:glyoxylase-like metal-dependent hydrolase (beta-lactamase superfamily II)